MTRELVEPRDIEPEIELFDASNVEHAKKLAAALWAVDIEVHAVEAPPAERWTMRDASGNVSGTTVIAKSNAAAVPLAGAVVETASGAQLSLGERTEFVPMRRIEWVAKIGGERYGNSIIVPADCERDGLRSIAANMVHTMLAMVVNGTIGRAPISHDNGGN